MADKAVTVLCRSCDLAVTLPPYQPGVKCVCPHCGAILRSGYPQPLTQVCAVAVSALILLAISIFEPFLSLSAFTLSQDMSLYSIFTVLRTDWSALLYVFLFFAFLCPAIMLLQIVLAGLRLIKPGLVFCRVYALSHHFCMVDVFVAGVLVSLIKLTQLAEVSFHSGFFTGLAFSLLLIWCWLKMPSERMWDMYMPDTLVQDGHIEPGKRGTEQNLTRCPHCGMVYTSSGHDRCPRCKGAAGSRIRQSRQKTFALLLTALILYVPANVYPIMFTDYLGSDTGSNITDGVISLWNMGSYFVALIILTASLFIPVFKILMLFYLLRACAAPDVKNPVLLSKLYRTVSFIGKWSMIDVFVVIIMSSTVRMSGLLTISPGFAIIAFCSVVLITMLAAESFDERLIWDKVRYGTTSSS